MDVKRYFPIDMSLGDPKLPVPTVGLMEGMIRSVEAVLKVFHPCFIHSAPPGPLPNGSSTIFGPFG